MVVEQLRNAVEASPRVELPKVSALLWKAYAAGQVTEAEASELSALIETRKVIPVVQKAARRRPGSRPRSSASMERRRRWAASGALPPALAARFTLAETAVLAVVAAEHRKRGDCRLTNKEIADVAGVCLTSVKNAMRAARGLNLLSAEERRLGPFRSASNVVRITDSSWRAWLRLRGGKSATASPKEIKQEAPAQRNRSWLADKEREARAALGEGPHRHGPGALTGAQNTGSGRTVAAEAHSVDRSAPMISASAPLARAFQVARRPSSKP